MCAHLLDWLLAFYKHFVIAQNCPRGSYDGMITISWTTLSPMWKVQLMTFENPIVKFLNYFKPYLESPTDDFWAQLWSHQFDSTHTLTRQCPKFAKFTKFLMATSWHQKVPILPSHGFRLPNHHVGISISLTPKVPILSIHNPLFCKLPNCTTTNFFSSTQTSIQM